MSSAAGSDLTVVNMTSSFSLYKSVLFVQNDVHKQVAEENFYPNTATCRSTVCWDVTGGENPLNNEKLESYYGLMSKLEHELHILLWQYHKICAKL